MGDDYACYECRMDGENYYIDDDGVIVCACDVCPLNHDWGDDD